MTNPSVKNRYFRASKMRRTDFDPFLIYGTMSASGGTSTTPDTGHADTVTEGHWIFNGNVSFSQGNTERACRYAAIQSAIHTMALLPESHSFHVDARAVYKASDLLGVMWENFHIEPPKVLPQDGEAVVFTWDHGDIKRYVTVDDEDVDVMDLHKTTQVKCIYEVQLDDEHAFSEFVNTIGLIPSSSTVDHDV